MTDFTLDSADGLRRSIGDLARVVRGTENTPDGQIETLGFLVRDGSQSIANLARLRRVRHQSMSTVVVELESRGLVARSADPADARGVLIELTTAGHTMIRESRDRRSRVIKAAAEISLSAEERTALAGTSALLDKLVAVLAGKKP